LVSTINAAIQQKLFTLEPNNFAWAVNNTDTTHEKAERFKFEFNLPTGHLIQASVCNSSGKFDLDEISIRAAYNPTGFSLGEVYASGYLSRNQDGAKLTEIMGFKCKNSLNDILLNIQVEPAGFKVWF
jgi:hypothetical protein